MSINQLTTASDFWSFVVEPDYRDYRASQGDLRAALHAANSFFHLHDWVFVSHPDKIRSAFTFFDPKAGTSRKVDNEKEFANALEQDNSDFGRIRGIANAGKHLKLRDVRPVENAPSHAANTKSVAYGPFTGYGPFGRFAGYFFPGLGKTIVLEGDGRDMLFSDIADSTHRMWMSLNTIHHWW